MMKIVATLIILLFFGSLYGQKNFTGVWQGVVQQYGAKANEGTLFFVNINDTKGKLEGKTREELFSTEFYAIQKISGKSKGNHLDFKQSVILSKKASSKITWCSAEFFGDYNDSTGYITGTFKSTSCRNYQGTFILFKSKAVFSETELPALGHAWADDFYTDIKLKRNAPEIRDEERRNFKFKSIYFDHDKTEIKAEYQKYLKEMIRVVNGHSDLRIQITGHTDADGSDKYNEDLSKRRALSLEHFFQENGLELKKLEIDFKGESQPVDNNSTEEGKKHNRRVDFKFI